MKLKYFLQLIILFFGCCFISIPCMAENFTAQQASNWAENKGREILDILTVEDNEDKYEKLDVILQNDVDLDYAAKFVVGKYWRQMNEDQREKYIPLFKRYTKSIYKGYSLDLKKGDVNFSVDKSLVDQKGVDVYCTVFIKALEDNVDNASKGGIKVIFSLVKVDDNIKVRDLKIEQVSFLRSYRDRFYKMIHDDNEDEIDWFLETLEEIVQDNEEKNEF